MIYPTSNDDNDNDYNNDDGADDTHNRRRMVSPRLGMLVDEIPKLLPNIKSFQCCPRS